MEKLYNALFEKGDYTGTFEEFKDQFGDTEKSKALYEALNDSGDYTDTFDNFNSQFGFEGKTEDFVDVNPTTESENTDLKSEIISLEQFDLMEPAEKRKLKYSDAQRLLRERSKRDKGGLDSFDVSSNDYAKITSKEKIRLDEEAAKQLAEEYNKEDKETSFNITTSEIEERAIKLLKEKTRPSLIESYSAQTARGFASFAKGTAEFANMVDYSIKEAALAAFDDDYEGTPEEKQALMNATRFTGGAGKISYASKMFIEKFLEPSIRKYENQTITEDVEDGNYFQAGERAVGAALESIPSVVAASFGIGGFVVLGASSAGDKFEREFSKDPSVNTGVLVANALATGTIEAGFEMVTRGVLRRSGLLADTGMKKAAADLIRGGTQKILTTFGINTIGEGASEMGTEISKLVLDSAPNWIGGLDKEVDLSIGSKEWKNIIDAGIVGSVFGITATGIGGIKNRNVNAVAAAESILMPQDGKQAVIRSGNKISELFKDRILADDAGVKLLDQAINTEINKIEFIKKENSQALGNMNPSEIKAYASNNQKIDKLKSIVNKPNQVESVKKIAEQDLKNLIQTNNVLFEESSNRRLRENINTVKDQAKNIEGLEIKDFANAKDIDAFVKEKGLEIDKKASGNQGFIYQDSSTGEQTIVINREIASKEKAVNVAAHEFLHGALFNTLKNSPDTQTALGVSLKATIDSIDLDKVSNSDFAKRLEQYANEKQNIRSEEVLTLFSDALATGDIKFNENIFTKIGDVVRRSLQKIGVEIKFNNGRDVYNFVKDYNNSISKGKLNKSQIKAAKEGVKGKLVSKAKETTTESSVKEAKQLTSEQDKSIALEVIDLQAIKKENKDLAAKYGKEPIKGGKETRLENKILESIDPIIGRVVTDRTKALYDPIADDAKKTVSRQDFQESMRSDIQTMVFDEFNGKQDIEKFIVNRAFLRANNLAQRLGIQSVEEGINKGLEAAEKVAVDETKTVEKDIKLTKATKILSKDQLKQAKDIIVKAEIKDKDLSYKKLKGLTAKVVSEVTGIPEGKIGNPAKNLSKPETTTAAMFIEKNVDYIRRTLPEGAVLEAASKNLIGTSTGVPKSLLDAFYVKGKRGDNLSPFILRKGLTNNEILETIGRPKDGKPTPIDPRSDKGSIIKAIIDLVNKNITNELVRTEKDLTIQQEANVGSGRSRTMFSKKILTYDELTPDQIKKSTELGTLRDKNKLGKALDFKTESIGPNTRVALQLKVLEAAELYGMTYEMIAAGNMESGGRWKVIGKIKDGVFKPVSALLGGKSYYQTTDPNNKYILATDKNKNADTRNDWVAKQGKLYYGVTDPAYQTLMEAVGGKEKLQQRKIPVPTKGYINPAWKKTKKAQEKINMDALDRVVNQLADAVNNGMSLEVAGLIVIQSYQATSGLVKIAAPFNYVSKIMAYGTGKNKLGNKKFREEHNPPASVVGAQIMWAIKNNAAVPIMEAIKKNYYQTQLSKKDDSNLDDANLDATLPEGVTIFDNPVIRLSDALVDLNTLDNIVTGKTMAEENGVYIDKSISSTPESLSKQKELIQKQLKDKLFTKEDSQKEMNQFAKLVPSKVMSSKSNNDMLPEFIKYSKPINIQAGIDALAKTDKALDIARDFDTPIKKIRVFDFDDTLARTKSNVLYTMPNGDQGAIDAATFARDAASMEAEGAVFDFSEFSKVMDGKKGPLFEVAKIIADKRGTDDVFVLTARPANSAGPIKEFLKSIGLDIPLKNITGLGNGDPQAKAGWIVGKAAEGYNDFYFADDATGNVKAVKEALSVLDVKSKVQQAYIKASKSLDQDFNKILENKTGIAAEKNYAKVKANVVGKNKGRFNIFIPPSAEDFVGLLYQTLGKKSLGDSQMKWYQENLLNPYARAMENITKDRNTLGRNFKALKKELNIVPKDLKKKINGEVFTKEQAARVYIWDQTGQDIPGLSKSDLKDLTDIVKNDAELELFAQEVMKLNKGTGYAAPKETWATGTITTDLLETLNNTKRKEYLEQWQQNVDVIFSEKNLNKMEAAYGKPYRVAMENILGRMKTGTNRNFGGDTLTGRFTDWLNGSTAAIMFFNTRSAVLQTISAVNFINFGDNNVLAAGKAFANQPQYWSDFKKLFNSEFLTERRDGLKINVSEADIADVAKENGVRGVINKLLKLGFAPTQIADSFAIASGGATFYRNRLKSLIKDGMDPIAAEKQAMRDFRETAEESQQSSRPDKISSQQAGPLGRIVLAFANTPAQYARIIKKAASDLKNGRGDAKSNISKILYYGVAQNLLFNALQQALFAVSFDDDDEVDKKKIGIVNGMADSLLRGMGIGGAVFSVVKNTAIKLHDQSEKKNPKYEDAALELLKISPPISSKIQKVRSAARSFSWNKKEMMTKGFSLDNPSYLAGGNLVSAFTNIPLDRVIKKLDHLKSASDSQLETYKRMALVAGWSEWELGIKKPKAKKKKKKFKEIW